jgi:Fic family protein
MHPSSLKKITPFPPRSFPPKGLQHLFCKELTKTHQALKEYNLTLSTICFPPAYLTHLMRLEAIASLESQKIKVSFKELLTPHCLPKTAAPVIHYFQALKLISGPLAKSPISKQMLSILHKKIKYGTVSKAQLGNYRKRQNWIGPKNGTIETAYFYPPAPKYVDALMNTVLRFYNAKRKEPLLQLALFFAQLLIIHPYTDGNGRMARILIPHFLYRKKILSFPCFFMSRYFKTHRLLYFQNLYMTTEQNHWKKWILFFLKGMRIEARKAQRLVQKMTHLYLEMLTLPKMNVKTLNFLFLNPIFTRIQFRQAGGSSQLFHNLLRLKQISQDKQKLYRFNPLLQFLK